MSHDSPMSDAPTLVLASASPRRRELLGKLLPTFDVLTSHVEEKGDTRMPDWAIEPISLPTGFLVSPQDDPRLWAWRKATDVLRRHRKDVSLGTILLGADTVVVAPGRLLGKPADRGDARDMLQLLRGREHYVVTGFVLLQAMKDSNTTLHAEAVSTKVTMRLFEEHELTDYLDTDEPYDKAGAYALQGLGGRLVERVEGCRTNVIGLPVCQVRTALERAGLAILEYPQEGYCDFCLEIPGRSQAAIA